MSRYAPDQEEKLDLTVECPECKNRFSIEIKVGINKPDVEVDIIDYK